MGWQNTISIVFRAGWRILVFTNIGQPMLKLISANPC